MTVDNKHYSWKIDPSTGDYVIANGEPIHDNSLLFPAYARLKIGRNKWMYAPDNKYGSKFDLIKKRTTSTPQIMEQIAQDALAPLTADSRAKKINVSVSFAFRHAQSLIIKILEQNGTTNNIEFIPVK